MKLITCFLALALYLPLSAQSPLLEDVKSIYVYGNVDPRIYPDAYFQKWKAMDGQILFWDYVPFNELDQDTVPSFLLNAASYFGDRDFDDPNALLYFLLERKKKPDLLLEMMIGDPYLIRFADDHEEIWVLDDWLSDSYSSLLPDFRGMIKEILYDFRDSRIVAGHVFSPPFAFPKPIPFDVEKEQVLREQYAGFMDDFPLYEAGALDSLEQQAYPHRRSEERFYHLLMNMHGYWYQLFEEYPNLLALVKQDIQASARWLCEQGQPRMVRWQDPYGPRHIDHDPAPPSNPIHFRLIEIEQFDYQIGQPLEFSALVCPLFNQATEAYLIEKYGEETARKHLPR